VITYYIMGQTLKALKKKEKKKKKRRFRSKNLYIILFRLRKVLFGESQSQNTWTVTEKERHM
jgi:hypothetical protein